MSKRVCVGGAANSGRYRRVDRMLGRDLAGTRLESLEPRRLLAAVSWDGDAGDNLWHTPANWSSNVVPTNADDVTIDVAGAPTLLLNAASGNRAVNSLTLRENLTISGGVALTVGTTAVVDGGSLLSLNNGRLSGGNWQINNGDLLVDSSASNNLTNLTWNGSIELLGAGNRLSFSGTVTINDLLTVSGANAELGMTSGATLVAEVVFPGTATGRRIGATTSNMTYTLGASSFVHGGAYTIGGTYAGNGWSNVTVVAAGTIGSDVASQTATISPATFSVAATGSLFVGAGNLTVSPGGSWTNAGTIQRGAGTLTLGGTFTTGAGIGTWTDLGLGGAVNVTGTIDNTGGALTLNTNTGVWTLVGGTISGGALAFSGSGGLGMNNDPGNRLSNVTVNGSITLADANDRLSFGTGVVVNGVINVFGATSEIGMTNGASLNCEIFFFGTAPGRRIGATTSNITYTFGPASNIHGGTFTIGGVYAGNGWSNVTVVNQGIITAETSTQTVHITPATFTNTGTLNVAPGNISIAPLNAWTSNGATVNVNAGALTIGGTYITAGGIGTWTRAGGAVNITGTVNNTGATLPLSSSTGEWVLAGGSITGGTVTITGAGGLGMNSDNANRLTGLTFNGNIALPDANDRLSFGAGVIIKGVITVTGANAEIGMTSGAVLNSEVAFPGSAAGRRIGATTSNITYTFGPAANIHGGAFTIGAVYSGNGWSGVSIVNQGIITAETAGQTVTINPANFSSTGVLNIGPGNITVSPSNAWNTSGATINVSAGTLTIAGTYDTSAGIGTWNRTGGEVVVTGAIVNTGATIVLNASTGIWTLANGTITGGTVTIAAGGGLGMNNEPGNRLGALTFNGDISLPDANDRLSFSGAVIVNGVITVSGANAEIGMAGGASLNCEIVFPGAATGRRIGATTSNITYTLGPASNIRGGAFTIGNVYAGNGWSGVTIVHQGIITAEVAGQTVTISPANFNSTGTLNVGPGNLTLSPSSAWSTVGSTINISAGTLTMAGTYVTGGGIGAWNRTGGTVNVTGAVDNTGGVVNLGASTGVWELVGGTIAGGTLNFLAGGGIGVSSDPSNRLSNITVNGNITLADANDRLSFGQTVTINGVTTLIGQGAELGMTSGAVLNSEVVFPGATTGRRIGATTSNITYTLGPSANVHGGPFTIGNVYAGNGWSGITVVNQGTIAADVAGQTATINPTVFNNTGTLTAGPGNLTVNTSQTWSTTGTVNINNVTFSIDGTLVTAGGIGAWNRNGGAVNVPGTIQNAGGAINLNAGTGEWTLTGGSIIGGVVNISAGGGLGVDSSSSNRLQDTTVNGNINLADANDRLTFGQTVTINGVITVSGAGAELGMASGAILNGEVAFPGAVAGRRIGATTSNMTYTLGPTANIHGGAFTVGAVYAGNGWSNITVVNQGRIAADVAGQTVTINPMAFTNTGTVAAGPGAVTIAPANASFTNDGTISIAPAGVVNVTGAYTQSAKGTLAVQVRGVGATDVGRLVVSGAATLAGELEVAIVNGFEPDCMNVAFLDAPVVAGSFTTSVLPPPPDDHQSLVVYFGNQVRFAISPPSDFNQDGILNSQDLFDFLVDFFAENADFNGDGITNSQDFFDFLSDFFEGC